MYDTKYKNPNFKEDELTKIINKYDGIICGTIELPKGNKYSGKLKSYLEMGNWFKFNRCVLCKKIDKVFNSPKAFVESVTVYIRNDY